MKLRFLVALFMPVLAWANITSQVNRTGPFTFAGSPQIIPVGIPFQQGSDLLVLDMGTIAAPHAAVTLSLGSDYTVSGGGYNTSTQMQVGSITVVSSGVNSVQTNDQLIILRNVPVNQTTAFSPSGPLTIQLVEKALDKQATLSQQLTEASTRSLRFPSGETLSGLMPLSARKGNVLGFDSAGNIAYYPFVSGTIQPQAIQGTANQVFVNGAAGVPATGSVLLTTPQDIAITSSVRFGKLGIGVAGDANSDVVISRSVPAASASAAVRVQGSLTAAYDLHPNAYRDTTVFTGTVAGDAYCSYDAQTQLLGTQTYNHFYGYQMRSQYAGTNTLGILSSFTSLNVSVASGTVTKVRGFYVSDASFTGGTVGGFDGLYIDQLSASTGATDIRAINIAGNNKVTMAGGQFWISADLAPVTAAARVDVTFDQASQYGGAMKNKSVTNTGIYWNFYNSSNVVQGSIIQSSSTVTAFVTTSDARKKENVRDVTNSGELIDALKPRVFDWKGGKKGDYGFIAQEVHKVYPQAVHVGGADVNKDPWMMEKADLMPVAIAELKSLRQRVAVLSQNNLLLLIGIFGSLLISITYTEIRVRSLKP